MSEQGLFAPPIRRWNHFTFSLRTLFAATVGFALFSSFVACEMRESPSRPMVMKVPALHGLTQDQLIAKLGPPDLSDTFPVGTGQVEFRVELLNFYPPDDPANHGVQIQELRWPDGDYTIVVWFHQVNGEWIALDSCRWHKSVQF